MSVALRTGMLLSACLALTTVELMKAYDLTKGRPERELNAEIIKLSKVLVVEMHGY